MQLGQRRHRDNTCELAFGNFVSLRVSDDANWFGRNVLLFFSFSVAARCNCPSRTTRRRVVTKKKKVVGWRGGNWSVATARLLSFSNFAQIISLCPMSRWLIDLLWHIHSFSFRLSLSHLISHLRPCIGCGPFSHYRPFAPASLDPLLFNLLHWIHSFPMRGGLEDEESGAAARSNRLHRTCALLIWRQKIFHRSIAKKRGPKTLTGQPHIICCCSFWFLASINQQIDVIIITFACINNKLISRAHSSHNAKQSIFIYLDLFVSLRCLLHWCVLFHSLLFIRFAAAIVGGFVVVSAGALAADIAVCYILSSPFRVHYFDRSSICCRLIA